jgi:hypothetical protein
MIWALTTQAVNGEELFPTHLFLHANDKMENVEAAPKFEAYRPICVQLAYSHTTTNASQAHPPFGECLSPPLGGALDDHFHLQVFERELRNANESTPIAKCSLF